MKLIIISDTHNLHKHFKSIPMGDVLIHCGDATTHGTEGELLTFLDWVNAQPHKNKIFVAGNHDWCLDTGHNRNEGKVINKENLFNKYNIHYLEHDTISINGATFYGHPYTPWHHGMGFNKAKGEEMAAEHNKIPDDIDVLITHCPPKGILDDDPKVEKLGSESLLDIISRVKPKIHCFGHVHGSWGTKKVNETTFFNAANHTWLWKNIGYTPPHVIELET